MFFGVWVVLGLMGMTVGLVVSNDEPGTGGTIFAAACLIWSLPYIVVANRRRTTLWIIVGSLAVGIALFGIAYRFLTPTPCGCD